MKTTLAWKVNGKFGPCKSKGELCLNKELFGSVCRDNCSSYELYDKARIARNEIIRVEKEKEFNCRSVQILGCLKSMKRNERLI